MAKHLFILLFIFLTKAVFPQFDSELFLEGASVTGITEENGVIWASTYGKGIFSYSKKEDKWTSYSSQNSKLDNDLFYTIAVSKDYIWAGASEGLFVYDIKKKTWRKRKFAQGGEFGNWIRTLKYDPKTDVLWIGRFRNLTHLDVKRQKYTDFDLTQKGDAKSNTFKTIKIDGDSVIYFGTENGFHTYDKKKKLDDKSAWEYFNNKTKNAFKNEGEAVSIEDFVFDKSSVWIATDEFVTREQPNFNIGGVYRYDRILRWTRYSDADGLTANGIYCVEKTGNKIWAGLYSFDKNEKKEYGKGMVLIDRVTGSIDKIDLNELNIKTASILSLYFDGMDLWIGSDRGLVRLRIYNPLAAWEGRRR